MGNEHTALKDQYPDFLSLDELRRICKISPRSARYLVESGVIPAIDTGKLTWRYKIAIDDVIDYLDKRETMGSMIPPGAATSRYEDSRAFISKNNRKSFSQLVTPGKEHEVAEYFQYIYTDFDEILTVDSLTEMTGLHKSTLVKLLKSGQIRSLEAKPMYLVPKQYLIEFVSTPRFIEAKSNSETFKRIIGGFEIWKTAKSLR